jgi:hypothetical protein
MKNQYNTTSILFRLAKFYEEGNRDGKCQSPNRIWWSKHNNTLMTPTRFSQLKWCLKYNKLCIYAIEKPKLYSLGRIMRNETTNVLYKVQWILRNIPSERTNIWRSVFTTACYFNHLDVARYVARRCKYVPFQVTNSITQSPIITLRTLKYLMQYCGAFTLQDKRRFMSEFIEYTDMIDRLIKLDNVEILRYLINLEPRVCSITVLNFMQRNRLKNNFIYLVHKFSFV